VCGVKNENLGFRKLTGLHPHKFLESYVEKVFIFTVLPLIVSILGIINFYKKNKKINHFSKLLAHLKTDKSK